MKEETKNSYEAKIDYFKLKKICSNSIFIKSKGVIPVVVQDYLTKEILILAYVNEEALISSLKTGLATFWSTSRNELWVKGLKSGSFLKIVDIKVNCELNSLLYLVKNKNGKGACHKKDDRGEFRGSCFYRSVIKIGKKITILNS